jgi:hypothetical protein
MDVFSWPKNFDPWIEQCYTFVIFLCMSKVITFYFFTGSHNRFGLFRLITL